MATLGELFDEDDARKLAEYQIEKAKEDAAWAALTPEQQQAVNDARAAKYDAMFNGPDTGLEDDESEECEESDEEE